MARRVMLEVGGVWFGPFTTSDEARAEATELGSTECGGYSLFVEAS